MSGARCVGLAALLLAAAGCAGPRTPFETHLASDDAAVRQCAAWYRALDARIDAAAVRDALYAGVPGFPYLRADALAAVLAGQAQGNERAMRAFVERLRRLDLEARRYELANLPRGTLPAEPALRRTGDCGALLRDLDLASAQARAALLAAAVIRTDESAPPSGACREARRTVAAPVRVRYAPPTGHRLSRSTVAGLLARAQFDPLGRVELSPQEVLLVAATYAPSFEVAIGDDGDRFGRLRWRSRAPAPAVDAAEPTVYVRAANAGDAARVRLRLVYTVWFPAGPVAWRLTLSPEGEPLLYDAIHACGCPPRSFPLAPIAEDERAVVSLASGVHAVERVTRVHGSDSLVRYTLRLHDELRSLERPDGTRASALRRGCA